MSDLEDHLKIAKKLCKLLKKQMPDLRLIKVT